MFGKRSVKKQLQQDLLERHLPESISVLGVFNKSGNYVSALNARLEIGPLVLKALQSHRRLRDLEYVSVVAASTVKSELSNLMTVLTKRYGKQFDKRRFGVKIDSTVWRAGLAFLSDQAELGESAWPVDPPAKVIVLKAANGTAMFLKREEAKNEQRIPFGAPTDVLERAVSAALKRRIMATSRSARTIRGVLRFFPRA